MVGSEEGYKIILSSYKNKNQRVIIITKNDFCYSANIQEVYEDSVLFLDKFSNQVLLSFSEIGRIGGSR